VFKKREQIPHPWQQSVQVGNSSLLFVVMPDSSLAYRWCMCYSPTC